jgi:hypothetical protein
MKNVYLYIMFLLIGFNGFGQGVDVIFLVDNSLWISGYPVNTVPPNTEYSDMYNSVQAMMSEVLECNSSNRVTVVQYSECNSYGNLVAVESDFKNYPISFTRRFNCDADALNLTVNFVSDRLMGIPDSSPSGTGKLLNRTPGNELVLFIFNQYARSSLVDGPSGNNNSFLPFDNFKSLHNAKIMMIHITPSEIDKKAGAAITSLGGNYYGAVENYSADPYGVGATPRYYSTTDDYALSSMEIQIWGTAICDLVPCHSDITLTSPTNNVASPNQDNRQAQNTITASNVVNNGAIGIYHAGYDVVLKPGFSSANGSVFRAYIEGCSYEYEGLRVSADEESIKTVEIDVRGDLFTLYPNPATDNVTITSGKVMQNITVTSTNGLTLFQRDIKANSYELNVSSYSKGLYVITVITEDGGIEMKKLIKE